MLSQKTPGGRRGKTLPLLLLTTALLSGCGGDEPSETGAPQSTEAPVEFKSEMTAIEYVDYLKGFTPAQLGLEGGSMDEYNVYPIEGMILVDNTPCVKICVYRRSQTDTNSIQGTYMLSGDCTHIFRLLPDGMTVKELDLTGPPAAAGANEPADSGEAQK